MLVANALTARNIARPNWLGKVLRMGKSIPESVKHDKKGAIANHRERQRDDLTGIVDQVTGAAKTTVDMTVKRSNLQGQPNGAGDG